jgi:hypothetical protein
MIKKTGDCGAKYIECWCMKLNDSVLGLLKEYTEVEGAVADGRCTTTSA